MKSKKIDPYDLKDLQVVQALASFLIDIGVKSAQELYNEIDYIADDEFCGECELHKDECRCNHEWQCDDDGDRAYDAWKDAQLENEHNQS